MVDQTPKTFKSVTLKVASDDEVIQAGIKPEEPKASATFQTQAPPTEKTPKPKVSASPNPKEPKPSDSLTTLDDLDGAPRPLAQKVVIGAAIVLIVVALVYYFVAMR